MDKELITDIDVDFALSIGFKFDDNEIEPEHLFTDESIERAFKTILRK